LLVDGVGHGVTNLLIDRVALLAGHVVADLLVDSVGDSLALLLLNS
jgi:hypothetical protein